MSEKVYKIFSLIFVISSVQTLIYNNDESPPYNKESKSSYLNYELNRFKTSSRPSSSSSSSSSSSMRNSYQYTNRQQQYNYSQHRLRHTHNNRFPKMDQILSRITNANSYTERPHIKTTENPFKKLYAVAPQVSGKLMTTEKSISTDYADDIITVTTTNVHNKRSDKEDDDEETKYTVNDDDDDDDDDDDVDVDDDDDDDDDEEEDDADDWQAEEATEGPTERTLTEYKWRHFGTRSRVEESRKNQGISNTLAGEVHQAVAHARKVVQQGACKTPRIRLIKIQNVYPDAGKAYIPHCTLLHRCSDETGCCRSDTLTCGPKTTERIELYFYTGRPGSYKVEKLAFYNHTECHCVEKGHQEVMAGDAAQDEDRYPLRPGSESSNTPNSIAEPIRRCKCPDLYHPQIQHGQCRCDCQEGNRDCMRIKRGKEYFSLKDRMCIQRQECGYPTCEFGVYIRRSGRCPRKQEKFEALSRIPSQ